ncbi:MAG: hypothetical protein K2X06_08875 [Burkholderiales bacterium]|nr:hypothetical protein [Burkholderiales bacterium]
MTGDERRQALLAVFDRLEPRQQGMLLDFAATLPARDDPVPATMRPEPRPAEESVVAAIRRLTRGFPAAGRRRLIGPVSALMAQHALQGRAATEVIDELEAVFERQHAKTVQSAK